MAKPNMIRFTRLVGGKKIDDEHATLVLKQIKDQHQGKFYHIVKAASSERFHRYYDYGSKGQKINKFTFKQGMNKGVPIWKVFKRQFSESGRLMDGRDNLLFKFHYIKYVKEGEANRLLLMEEL